MLGAGVASVVVLGAGVASVVVLGAGVASVVVVVVVAVDAVVEPEQAARITAPITGNKRLVIGCS